MVELVSHTLRNPPIIGLNHAPILLKIDHTHSQGKYTPLHLKQNDVLILALFILVKDVWSSFIKESYAYQFIRKTQLLKQALKTWERKT